MKFDSLKAQAIAITIMAAWMATILFALSSNHTLFGQLVLIFLIIFLSVGLFITAHDSMHGLISPRQKLNDWYGKIALYLYGAFSFKKLKQKHIEHHENPVSKSDPDYTDYPNEDFALWFWSFMRRYYGLKEFGLMHGHIIFFLWVADWNVSKVLIFYALPSLLSAIQLFYFGTYLPHRTGTGHTNEHNARSNDFNEFISLITCYHFGYHYEHHAYPGTPWWKLPSKRKSKKENYA